MVPAPRPDGDAGERGSSLTIFMTEGERARVVAALRRLHRRRAEALFMALGLSARARGGAARKGAGRG